MTNTEEEREALSRTDQQLLRALVRHGVVGRRK